MIDGLLGRKVGMTQIFTADGRVVPVTVIEAGPCYVTQIKTVESDGYTAVQLGFDEVKRLTKPEKGHLDKVGAPPLRHLREFRADDTTDLALGQKLDASAVFSEGDLVDVVGTS